MDSEAFVDAHRRYAAIIHSRCRRILRDAEAARDVTKDQGCPAVIVDSR